MKYFFFTFLLLSACLGLNGQTVSLSDFRWLPIEANGDVVGRHENAFIEYHNKFYLIGGRGVNPVNVFDPKTNSWETKGKSPMEIHHFQAVVYGNAIYLVGAMTGGYPEENPLDCIWIYYPETDKWVKGAEIPEPRRRGGAGAVVFDDKIYIAGGIKLGHTSGTTNYFDSYDLKTGKWEALTDAPHIRDHFPAIVANAKMYCIGGRNTSVHHPEEFSAFFNATISEIDYYDFLERKWYTLKEPLPVPTAAGGLVKMDNNLLYIGGEGIQNQAYNQSQCLDLSTGKWSQLAPLNTGRHGSGAVLYDNTIYFAAGSPNKGGGNLSTIEVFSLNHYWKKLFNGKNWDGWYLKIKGNDPELSKKLFAIEEGVIHIFNSQFPDKYKLGTGENDTHGMFYTQKKYSKYILRFEYKWGTKVANNFNEWQYDAGCYYHVTNDQIWPTGFEYQIRYDHTKSRNHTGDLIQGGTQYKWFPSADGTTFLSPNQGGKAQDVTGWMHYASTPKKFNALNEKWNKCEIIVMGDQYAIHKLNGEIINIATDLSVGEGIIGLQSETAEIFYKNIEIKEFDAIIPMENFLKR
jgi:Domain of Unknown Function (DUF1080)/Kelch motif